LIGTGHFLSHFYFLTLPPLFPFLKEEFGISYAALGLIMAVASGTSGVAQIPVGFLVDRIGARLILTTGLVMMALGFGLIGLTSSYWVLMILVIIGGVGHSVFHPADYAILSSSIDQQRMGRAFSIHTFAGHLGSAVAPATIIFLAALWSWRAALVIAGVAGLLATLALATQWNSLHDDAFAGKKHEGKTDLEAEEARSGAQEGLALLLSKPMLLFFLFFAMTSMTSSGMHSFSVAALVELHGTPLAVASAALTGYLFASALGILLGGVIADRTSRHDYVAALAFIVTGVLVIVVAAVPLNVVLLLAILIFAGLTQGVIRPARDMMVRAASPRGSTGKVFGFVSAGIAAGGTLSPILFGFVMDLGRPEWVFYLIAVFMAVALVTVVVPKENADRHA
ncbi:MAG: MFS transporter, partial [Rhodospirillales bacterium]